MFRARTAILAVAAAAIFASAPAMAQDHSFKIFLTADWVSPLGDDVTFESVQDAVQGSDDFGVEAGFEARANKLLGIEASYLVGSTTFELEDIDDDLGEADQQALTAALNFHILPTKVFDLWLAPVVSWYSFGDFELDDAFTNEDVDLENEWGYGGAVGFDINIGDTFSITGGVRYIKIDIPTNQGDVPYDPVIARVGIAFRFGDRN